MNLTDIKTFKSIILLNEIITNDRVFKTVFNSDDSLLEPLFIELLSKGYLKIDGDRYISNEKGIETFDNFMKRYTEYLKVFDIYSFVDLEKGEFAFSKFFDFNTDDDWNKFKMDQRFDDVRITVALFKKLNPHEIVFMSFINENRFDTSSTGWQVELLSDNIWTEIDKIVESAITPQQLGSEDVILDIIDQGTSIMIDLLKKEAESKPVSVASNDGDDYYEEEYVTYETYYDPYYVPSFWLLPLFIW
jgi:hypothetical protein